MGIRFTLNPEAYLGKEFPGDRYQITHSHNLSGQDEAILISLSGSDLFGEHIDQGPGIYKEKFTLGYITHQAVAKKLLKPDEAIGFQNFLVKLFSKVSKDRKLDTKEEFSLLRQAALYLDLNLVRGFIKKSDQPSAWLTLSPEQMKAITKFAGDDFKFEGASKEQQKELDRLKEQMDFAPLATAEVQEYFASINILVDFIIALRGGELYHKEEDKKIQLDEAFISLCRFYPENIDPGMLNYEFRRFEKDIMNPSSDRMRDYLLGTNSQEPAPILQQILNGIPSETNSFNIAGTHFGTYCALIKTAAGYGHPDALKAVAQYLKPDGALPFPLYQAGESMTPHYKFVEPLVDLALNFVSQKIPETVPQHLRDGAVAFQENLGLQLAFLYRQPGIMGGTVLVGLIEKGEEGFSLFEKLEAKWKEYCKQNKKRYQPVDFDIITNNILNLQMEGDDIPGDFKVKHIEALYKLAILWKMEEGMEGLERAIYGEHRVTVKVFKKLVDIAILKEGQDEKREEFSKRAQNFFHRNMDVSRLTDAPPGEFFYYGFLAEDLSRLLWERYEDKLSRPEYSEAFKLVQFIVTNAHGSSPERLIRLLAILERDHQYEGKPAETLKELILKNDGGKSNMAWYELDTIFYFAWSQLEGRYSGEDQKRFTGHVINVAEANNDATLDAARSLIDTCRRTSDPGLTQALKTMSIDGITFRENQDLTILSDLSLIGNRKAFDFIMDRFIQGDLSMKKMFEQILAEDADGVISSLHEEIIDMATNLVLEEENLPLGQEAFDLLVSATNYKRPGSWTGLGEIALSISTFAESAASLLLSAGAEEPNPELWSVLIDFDKEMASRVGVPSNAQDEVEPLLVTYNESLLDLMGTSQLGKAICSFYEKRRTLEKPAEFTEEIEPKEELRVEDRPSEDKDVQPNTPTVNRTVDEKSHDGGSILHSTRHSPSRRNNKKISEHPSETASSSAIVYLETYNILSLEELHRIVLNNDVPLNDRLAALRELANRASSYEGPETTATLKEIILAPGVEISIVTQALEFLIHLTNQQPPLPSLSMQMMELIQEATEIARHGDNAGRMILEIIHELGNIWYSAQARNGLESLGGN